MTYFLKGDAAPAAVRNKPPMHQQIHALFPHLRTLHPKQCAPLVLAYIGDCIYDLYVRTLLLHHSDATAHGLHMQASKLVCAKAQAGAYRKIEPLLSPEEEAVFRRGRNAHMGTIPKNMSIADYRAASGFEALLGYLFLCDQNDRIDELMHCALEEHFGQSRPESEQSPTS